MRHSLAVLLFGCLCISSCKPPASDDYVDRTPRSGTGEGPSEPIESPNIDGAVWADGKIADRLLYGKPGDAPMIALTCTGEGSTRRLEITRFVLADPEAKAMLALIGNGHMSRLPIESEWNGKVWLWEGRYESSNPDLDVLSGPRKIEATIPGAGSVELIPSERPGALLDRCRRLALGIPEPE